MKTATYIFFTLGGALLGCWSCWQLIPIAMTETLGVLGWFSGCVHVSPRRRCPIRASMHARLIEELTKLGKPFQIVTGAHEVRLAAAIKACDTVTAG